MKLCTKCKIEYPPLGFYLGRKGNWCRKCWNKFNSKYYHYNKESRDLYVKEFRLKYGFGPATAKRIGLQTTIELFDRDKRKCTICDSEENLTVDHIDGNGRHNLEKGLPMNNNLDNLRILCRRCHGSISGKLYNDFRRSKLTTLCAL